jgi:lysozyme family protein
VVCPQRFINSGTAGRSTTMLWPQLSTLAAAGDEIGGKTVDGTNLTTLSSSQQIAEICNDRQAILQHGLKASSFAYPGGAFNTTIESEVQNCGAAAAFPGRPGADVHGRPPQYLRPRLP